MATSDQANYNLRYNEITGDLEIGAGNIWTVVTLANAGGITQLTGQVTAGPGTGSQAATVSNAAVIAKVLTGYVSGAGTVAATDSILQAIQKVNGNDALKLPLAGGTLTGTLTQDKAPAYLTLDRTASFDSPITLDARLIASSVDVNVDAACTINGPTNGTELQKITFALRQTGAGFTVTFTSGAGNFAFGTDIPSFTASGAGLTDYVGAIWSPDANRWHIVSVIQGF